MKFVGQVRLTDPCFATKVYNEPLQDALWSVVIGGTMPSTNASNVSVDFELDPTALNEITLPAAYLASLGSYSNQASEAALIDQSMDNEISGDMTGVAGEDDLPEMDPFPSGTTFTPETNDEEYADGVDAGIEAPEPGASWLVSLGAMLALWRRSRPSRFDMSAEKSF